ncbi:Protein tweety-2 [Frankliniella fusca]|uniref:Protein tweety homolog n=1 Tax=Frankliniella fusca TaxID=407009 RepID=A0AAE1L6R7_9NEOP|nr:Protein tweety-2 [Frankliniella fusca]
MGVGDYEAPFVARLLHNLPHLNIRLQFINSTFAPENELYLESLGILAFIPAACLILTLLILLMYFLTRCCDRKPRRKRTITACKWVSIVFIVLLTWAAIAASLYGNHDIHEKMVQVLDGLRGMDSTVRDLQIKTERLKEIRTEARQLLDPLQTKFRTPPSQNTDTRQVELGKEMDTLANFVDSDDIYKRFTSINKSMHNIFKFRWLNTLSRAELIRWIGTMGMWGLLVLFCLILLIGMCRYSRCTLITFSVCGLLAVIVCWLQASIYLIGAVAIGDYCMQPDVYLESLVHLPDDARVLEYYMRCPRAPNPWGQVLNQTRDGVNTAFKSYKRATQISDQLYPDAKDKMNQLGDQMNKLTLMVPELHRQLDCNVIYPHYLASSRICHKGLYGLCLMLLASAVCGICFTILFWVDSHTWIYLGNRKNYQQVDGQDPYLPPTAASQAIAARTLRSQGSYGSSGLFRHKMLHDGALHAASQHLLDGRGFRDEKSQHGNAHRSGAQTLERRPLPAVPIPRPPSVSFVSSGAEQRQPSRGGATASAGSGSGPLPSAADDPVGPTAMRDAHARDAVPSLAASKAASQPGLDHGHHGHAQHQQHYGTHRSADHYGAHHYSGQQQQQQQHPHYGTHRSLDHYGTHHYGAHQQAQAHHPHYGTHRSVDHYGTHRSAGAAAAGDYGAAASAGHYGTHRSVDGAQYGAHQQQQQQQHVGHRQGDTTYYGTHRSRYAITEL